ncbi:hypothetical protein RYX36_001379 [Vicia faba]
MLSSQTTLFVSSSAPLLCPSPLLALLEFDFTLLELIFISDCYYVCLPDFKKWTLV